MPKFIIERDIPGAGQMTPAELQAIAQRSCAVLRAIGPRAQWIESYVADDKIYCIYIADDVEAIKEHAEQGGFPANRISEVRAIIDPATV
ncbi:MAG: DUF4242 domain-containing protein [Alphaproteobacteria bacterium]|nr:DUF4242 domain-containing protein [Alphaproteobacteria bacterium]MBM3652168.1 DUF4242 domain-containing protein [Alphaproteobacteria bacterium]